MWKKGQVLFEWPLNEKLYFASRAQIYFGSFQKFAIGVKIGVNLLMYIETASTIIVSEDFTITNTITITTQLRIRLVCNDLAIAGISDGTASSSYMNNICSKKFMVFIIAH